MVAVSVKSAGGMRPSRTVSVTVIVVSPPAGSGPTQVSKPVASGALQLKPFDPSAFSNVADAELGSWIAIFTGSASCVPALTATIVYFTVCPGAAGSGLSVTVDSTRSNGDPPTDVVTLPVLSVR